MAEDPNLNNLNEQANTDPTEPRVQTQKIRDDDSPVGGVALGAINKLPLIDEADGTTIESAVDRALTFKPKPMKSSAVVSAAARIRQDFLNIQPYITSRNRVVTQLHRLLSRRGGFISQHAADQVQTINALIMERTLAKRLDEANKVRTEHLNVAHNLLRFQTTATSTYMKQSLALHYRQIFAVKNLVTIMKSFADMAENKLDAIKINTSLPDAKKLSIFEETKKLLIKKGLAKSGDAVLKFLSHETLDDAKNHVSEIKSKILSTFDRVKGFGRKNIKEEQPTSQTLKDKLTLENLWKHTNVPRNIVSTLIKEHIKPKLTTTDKLLKEILEKLTISGNIQTPGILTETKEVKSSPPISTAIIKRFLGIEKSINVFGGSFEKFKELYETNANRSYDILKNIDTTLLNMSSMGSEGEPKSPNENNTSSIFSQFNLPGGFGRRTFVFADVYRKDHVIPGEPLVTREQFINHSVVLANGKEIRSLNDITMPVLDKSTGNVLISNEDLKDGLVDIHNKEFSSIVTKNHRGILNGVGNLIGGAFSAYGSILGFQAKFLRSVGSFLFKKQDRSPYEDIYISGEIKPGYPLVTAQQLRDGLVFSDGSRVLNVNQIDRPVLDPRTGQTVITEDDIRKGLVDVYGKSIIKKNSQFSTLGGIFDLTKFGIKTGGSLIKPVIGMYGEIFKMFPKVLLSVGNFVSKSIIGILSGKAPGALAKGLTGITSSITKMYASMFGLSLKGIGAVGGAIFGKLFGGKKPGLSSISKKDIYDLISVRLDHIYSLLDHRLAKPVRAGSYQAYEDDLKKERAKLLHLRDEDIPGTTISKVSVFSRLAALMGLGGSSEEDNDVDKSDDDSSKGGIVNDIESGAETMLGGALLSKLPGRKYLSGFLGKGARKLFGLGRVLNKGKNLATEAAESVLHSNIAKEAAAKVSGLGTDVAEAISKVASKTGAKAAAEDVAKIASKSGLGEVLKLGGKSLLKDIPGIGAVAGLGFAADDAYHGDYKDAVGDAASGLVSLVPIVGTSASVAIDGWMAYNTFNKADSKTISKLFKARLKVYGVDVSKASIIHQLETRTLQMVISHGGHKFTPSEVQHYAKLFGFDPEVGSQFQYFCSWIDNRFRPGYLMYIALLKKYNYNVTAGEADIRQKDMSKIISEYNKDTETTIAAYPNLIPTVAAYQSSPLGKSAQPTTSPTSPFATTNQSTSVNSSNTNQTALSSVNSAPVVKTAYSMPANQNTNRINQYGYGNGLAQTQELTYTRRTNANDNVSVTRGYVPSLSGSISGSNPGGIRPSITTQMAAARAGYVQQAGVAGGISSRSLPTGQPFYNAMYGLLYNAAVRQGVPNPAVIAQLGAAQSALETGNGRHVPGGNYFGIKATSTSTSTTDSTHEFIDGRMITENQNFRSYGNPQQSASDYIKFLLTNERYRPVLAATNINQAIEAQAHTGYATDPNYGSKLTSIVNSHPSPTGTPAIELASYTPTSNTTTSSVPSTSVPTTALIKPVVYTPPTPSTPIISRTPSYVSGYGGPTNNVLNPIKSAVDVASSVQDGFSAISQKREAERHQPSNLQVQTQLPPELLDASKQQILAAQKSLDTLGGIHTAMRDMFNHLQYVHGPEGIFNEIADNTANIGKQQPNVSAPIINMTQPSQQNCQDNVGFSVKKKRVGRYNV